MASIQYVAVAQQKDHLCGPYFAVCLLRDFRIADADEDFLSRKAGRRSPTRLNPAPPGAES